MKRLWKVCLSLALGLAASHADAQEMHWRPADPPKDLGVRLNAPVALPGNPSPLREIYQASFQQTPTLPLLVRGQAPDPLLGQGGVVPPPPPPPPPGPVTPGSNDERLNCGQTVVAGTSGGGGPSIFDQGKDAIVGIPGAVGGVFQTGGRCPLQSDHAFDSFCSPISNPFYMMDPRSLTEIKPLVIYQRVPGHNEAFQGGDIWWYGVQGSVAITDMFSIEVPKLGLITLHPNNQTKGITNSTGFSEFVLGPKFTFIRSESTKTLLAAGLNFDLALGGTNVHQDTGTLSLIPYLSFAQNFGKSSYGSFNYMTTVGYSFATDNQRTDFFVWSNHIDYDVANLNKIFPMIELNWFHYTTNGGSKQFFGFEGGDLINFGSGGVAGLNQLSLALGVRYKFTEWLQMGFAAEFPLLTDRDFMNYRLGLDLIFRY